MRAPHLTILAVRPVPTAPTALAHISPGLRLRGTGSDRGSPPASLRPTASCGVCVAPPANNR